MAVMWLSKWLLKKYKLTFAMHVLYLANQYVLVSGYKVFLIQILIDLDNFHFKKKTSLVLHSLNNVKIENKSIIATSHAVLL